MKKLLSLGLVALALWSCTPSADSSKLVFGTDSTWPPMEFINADKQLVGFDIDMVKAIGEAAGFTPEFQSVSWDGIFAGLESGQYSAIVSSVTINEERQARYDFTAPYINAGQVLIVDAASTLQSIEDLKGKTVGVQIGTSGAFAVQKYPEITLKEFSEVGMAVVDLVNGNVQGVVCDSPVAADYVLQNPQFNGKLKIVGAPMTAEELGMVVRKGDAATLALLNKGLEIIKANGKLDEIKAKWGLK